MSPFELAPLGRFTICTDDILKLKWNKQWNDPSIGFISSDGSRFWILVPSGVPSLAWLCSLLNALETESLAARSGSVQKARGLCKLKDSNLGVHLRKGWRKMMEWVQAFCFSSLTNGKKKITHSQKKKTIVGCTGCYWKLSLSIFMKLCHFYVSLHVLWTCD